MLQAVSVPGRPGVGGTETGPGNDPAERGRRGGAGAEPPGAPPTAGQRGAPESGGRRPPLGSWKASGPSGWVGPPPTPEMERGARIVTRTGGGHLTRRATMRCAAGAVVLLASAGCAGIEVPLGARRQISAATPPVRVVLLGLAGDAALGAILADWPAVRPSVQTAAGPDAWLCPGQAWAAPTVFGQAVGRFVVQGRTALGFAYGAASPPLPSLPKTSRPMPDVILTTTVWTYWIGHLLADLSEVLQAPGMQSQVQGVPREVLAQGLVYAPGRGSFLGTVPILRSPLALAMSVSGPPGEGGYGLSAPAAPSPWRWSDLVALLEGSGSTVAAGFGFTVGKGFATAAELAAAIAVAYGGGFGAPPKLAREGALEGWAETLPLFAAGTGAVDTASVEADYLLPPYETGHAISLGAWGPTPVPSGPAGRAVPVAHVVAGIPAQAPHPAAAAAFIGSLLSAQGQQRLRSWKGGGLLVRPADALAQLGADYPRMERPGDWVDAGADLTPARLWGGPLTDADAPGAYAAADALQAALPAFRATRTASDVRRVVGRAEGALAALLPTLGSLRLGSC